MDRSDLARLMATMEGRVDRRTLETARKVLEAAFAYGYLGGRFTFSANADLDEEVNRLLLALSDDILADIDEGCVEDVPEDDRDAVLLFARRPIGGKDVTERVDSHASRLKYLLEGYLAVCFASGFSKAAILGDVSRFLHAPNAWPPMQEAYADPEGFAPAAIRSRGYHFGRGVDSDPSRGLALVLSTTVNGAWQYEALLGYQRNPDVIGYKVHRGSDYDCPECDELCIGIHPLDEIVLPAHPHCMCYTTPVRRGEI